MLEPEEVSAMLRLKELGWGAKRIAQELGISRNTVKDYIAAGGWAPYQQPERKKALDGLEEWLRERLRRHRGNADVIRQELAAEMGIVVSLRTVERAVKPYRRELEAEARATVRFETAPGRQMQIDFSLIGTNRILTLKSRFQRNKPKMPPTRRMLRPPGAMSRSKGGFQWQYFSYIIS